MADTKKIEAEDVRETGKAAAAVDPEELVDFTAPYDPTGAAREILLSVNGETVRVKRGETVKLKRKFVEVWENANAQTAAARMTMEKAMESGKTPLLEM